MFEQDPKEVKIQFAAAALSGLLGRGFGSTDRPTSRELARTAWEIAEIMYEEGGNRVKIDERDDTGPA